MSLRQTTIYVDDAAIATRFYDIHCRKTALFSANHFILKEIRFSNCHIKESKKYKIQLHSEASPSYKITVMALTNSLIYKMIYFMSVYLNIMNAND